MDILMLIALITGLVILGVICGAIVQKATYFLYPVDVFTLLAIAFVAVQGLGEFVFDPVFIGLETFWYLPFLLGYFAGYLVSGRTDYIMIRRFSPGKSTVGEYWIVYERDGKTYRQTQSNRELLKRILFGVEHEVVSNIPLSPDWSDTTKYPLLPIMRKTFLMAETWETVELPPPVRKRYNKKLCQVVDVVPRIYLRRYVTTVRVANGSMVSRLDLIRDMKALDSMQGDVIEFNNEIFRLRQSLNIQMADTVAQFLADVYSKAPGASMSVAVRRWVEKQKAKERERDDGISKEE